MGGARFVVRGGVAFSDFVHKVLATVIVVNVLCLIGQLDKILLPFFVT